MRLVLNVRSLLLRLLPKGSVFADDRLTTSGLLLVRRLGAVAVALVLIAVAVVLLDPTSWADVMSGALFAWGVAVFVWAFSSYTAKRDAGRDELLREVDMHLLHARLNHIADRLGAPTLGLSWQLGEAHRFRQERVSHLSGREEYTPEHIPAGDSDGVRWWDMTAMGDPDDV